MAKLTDLMATREKSSAAILDDLTIKMQQALTQTQISTHPSSDNFGIQMGIKLDGQNYALWSQVMEMYIAEKDKLGYILGDIPQPEPTDPTFLKWRTENVVVKCWLINSMESSLISNFIRYPTAQQVWDAVAITFFDGSDTSQVYDLKRQVARTRQNGGSIESYYNTLQKLWRKIDFRCPNPIKCAEDI